MDSLAGKQRGLEKELVEWRLCQGENNGGLLRLAFISLDIGIFLLQFNLGEFSDKAAHSGICHSLTYEYYEKMVLTYSLSFVTHNFVDLSKRFCQLVTKIIVFFASRN